jgi:hypothetical protein
MNDAKTNTGRRPEGWYTREDFKEWAAEYWTSCRKAVAEIGMRQTVAELQGKSIAEQEKILAAHVDYMLERFGKLAGSMIAGETATTGAEDSHV